jgi:hypothetical protein
MAGSVPATKSIAPVVQQGCLNRSSGMPPSSTSSGVSNRGWAKVEPIKLYKVSNRHLIRNGVDSRI